MSHIDTSNIVRASLWIRPSGAAFEQLSALMRRLHKQAGGPAVHPHVSVLGGIETTQASAELKLKKLASRTAPFTLTLGAIEWRHEYFRCLYAKVVPSAALAAVHREAHAVFEMNPPDPFEPHLSLLYGTLDEARGNALAAEAGGKLDVTFRAIAVHLVNASAGLPATEWRTLCEREFIGASTAPQAGA